MLTGETSLCGAQPREHPWGWALCCSLFTHAGVVLALGLYMSASRPPMSLPRTIKVDLISLPARPKVKNKTAPTVIPKPLLSPPAQKPRPPIPKQTKPAVKPVPAVIHDPKPDTLPQHPETPIIEPQRAVAAEAAQHAPEDLLAAESAERASLSLAEAETGAARAPSVSAPDMILHHYSNQIRERINKVKRYPQMARKAGRQGTVVVEFSVNRQGKLLGSKVVDSCGTKALDKAALKALKRASPFAPLPNNLKSPHTFNLQINFFLAG